MKVICFDMDGTIADLYAVEGWLDKLRSEDASPYEQARPMWDMQELNKVLMLLEKEGWEIRIISWLSKDSTEEYKTAVRKAKTKWLEKYNFPAQKYHFVRYGATKAESLRKQAVETAILIDDNDKVRKGWHLGETVNPIEVDIIDYLSALL